MHLSGIKLRGFKSFPDPVEIRLEPGVAVVVGPNGSGKSNVADAIVWAAGSLSPSELRAERPDDVLFAGGGVRRPADHCEVELLFDNSAGDGPIDYSDLSVARRLQRGGEGQYLLNRTPVRRIDLVELLADLGLGGGMHSIIGQGRVEEILASSPGKRRELLEEAAGLGRFKRRRHRAELKLARVAIQVERARDVEDEVRKRLRPLALQATAAERAERLRGEIAALHARIALLDLERLDERRAEADERRAAALLARRRTEQRLEGLLAERQQAEDELARAAGGSDGATHALYRVRSARDRLAMRREALDGLLERLRDAPQERQRADAARRRARLGEELRHARERLAAVERLLAEREGLPPAARALAEGGEALALSQLDVEPGQERAVAAALGWRAGSLVAVGPAAALALLERARAEGLGNLAVVVGDRARQVVRETRVVAAAELLAQTERAVTPDGYGYDPAAGELWFTGEAAEAVMLELDVRRRALAAEVAALERRTDVEPPAAPAEPTEAEVRVAGLVERALASLALVDAAAASLEPRLRARADAVAARAGEVAARLRELAAHEAESRRHATEASERAGAVDVELARIEAEAADARRRLEAAAVEPAEGDDRAGLVEKAERLERRREALGQVNPLAKQEYEQEKERLTELSAQREDLERSLQELEQLRRELTETVERRFAETFAAVQAHFTEVAATLFPGGDGRLSLTEPDDDGGAHGIEVELRPAGKRITRLSLLSGGEKALAAISFLFALFLARPCPFYLLDEVEAALDDTNIGRFVELLRRYADRAQFIVITHQKRTMEAADVLYGVTMGTDGVSQIVSRRVARDEAVAAAS